MLDCWYAVSSDDLSRQCFSLQLTRIRMATVTSPTKTLPSPTERPNAYVLIFDGKCKFCWANVGSLAKIDQGKVAYLSLHDPIVAERWPKLTHEMLMDRIYLIDQQNNKLGGAAAFRFLSRKLIGLWLLAPLLHIPGSLPLWQFVYRCIAKVRYRFGRIEDECEDGTCHLHFE